MADLGAIATHYERSGGLYAKLVSGVVLDASGNPARAQIKMFLVGTDALVWYSQTNFHNGAYALASPLTIDALPMYLICRLLSGTENALILDNVIPL